MRFVFLVILCLLLPGNNQLANGEQPSVGDSSLYKTLLFNEIPEYSPAKLNINAYPEAYRARLLEYRTRWKSFQSHIAVGKGSREEQMVLKKKIQVERGIVSLVNTKGIGELAAEYADKAPISLEWEGMSDGPIGEAEYAENELDRNPQSPMKPYLVLFLLHRYRIAFECLDYEKEPETQAMVSNKYREYLKMAKADKDILVGLIAGDIDKQHYLYIKTEKHP